MNYINNLKLFVMACAALGAKAEKQRLERKKSACYQLRGMEMLKTIKPARAQLGIVITVTANGIGVKTAQTNIQSIG